MKYTGILLLAVCMQVSASALSQEVSLKVRDAKLENVFDQIRKQTGYNFLYKNEVLAKANTVTAHFKSRPLKDVLDALFKGQEIEYVISDKTILIKPSRETIPPKTELKPVQRQEIQLPAGERGALPARLERAVDLYQIDITVNGTVKTESGETLPGVSILLKGTQQGAVTDVQGRFSMNVPDGNAVLVFSFVGYVSREVIVGNRTFLDISLAPDIKALDEVVVTAFGIEREKKALSYSVQEVGGQSISAVGNSNVVNSLQGKVAGVVVKQTSGAPGAQHRITIRGSRTFTGNNEPLYVIDGLPVSSGGRTIDINPNDIKSVNILKGPTAAALYGLRASNGVIIIETRKGSDEAAKGKPSISFETNYNIEQLSLNPKYQKIYAQGENESFVPHSAFSWGPRISEMGTYTNQLGEQENAAVYDNVGDLFKSGGTFNTNLLVSNSLEKVDYAINLGYTDQTGILDKFGMQRVNLKFAGGYKLSDKLKVNTSVSYSNTTTNSVDLPWWGTFAVPVSYNLKGKPTHTPGDPFRQINFRGQHDNYYWALENNYSNENTSRTFGNISFDYTPVDWIKVNYRLGLDEYADFGKSVIEKGSAAGRTDPPSGGSIRNRAQHFRQINSNLNVIVTQKIGDDLSFDFMLGNEFYDIQSKTVSNLGSDIVIGGFHHISNTAIQTTTEDLSRSRVFGTFANLSLAWRNSIFLNATGRNDIVSNMPRQNRSFFYPSLGLGVAFTEFLSIPRNILTFGKVRASIAEVGQAGPAHSTENLYITGSAGGFTFPYSGLNAFTHSSQLNADDLRPENTRTIELGVDLRFLNNRIGLDYTYYTTKASGQIYRVPIALSTGYASELRNAGEMSVKGHEITLTATPVSKPAFQWDMTANFTTYKNRVISLAEGIDQLELGGFMVTLVAQPGQEYPSIRGWGYLRDPSSGEVVVDNRAVLPNGNQNPRYGMPLRSTDQLILGSAQPDFELGFSNELTYKNLSLSAQIDWRQGGKVSSGYNRLGKLYGVLSETENRETADYVFPGKKGYYGEAGTVVVEADNDIPIVQGQEFFRFNQDLISESNVYNATYVRLRELKISYSLPDKWFEKSFVRSASFYLTGRNLWLKAALPHFDPEMFNTTEGESYNTYPQTRSFGGGIRINL